MEDILRLFTTNSKREFLIRDTGRQLKKYPTVILKYLKFYEKSCILKSKNLSDG